MAATTLKAIMDRFQVVLEGSPLRLKPTKEPFSHDRSPNAVIDTAYRIEDGGMSLSRPVGANQFVRVDRLTVYLAKKFNFAAQESVETLETTLNTIERRILNDDADNSYHASVESRRVTRVPDADVMVGSLVFLVDFDFNANT